MNFRIATFMLGGMAMIAGLFLIGISYIIPYGDTSTNAVSVILFIGGFFACLIGYFKGKLSYSTNELDESDEPNEENESDK